MLLELLTDLVRTDDVLFVVRSGGDGEGGGAAISEIRSGGSLDVRQKDKWITIGGNDDPAHMHVNADLVCSAEFVREHRPERRRISFGVRFLGANGERVLAAFFTKMYGSGGSGTIIPEREEAYDRLRGRYPSKILFKKNPA